MRIMPTKYSQLTVKQFLEVDAILSTNLDLYDKKIKIINLLTGLDAESIPFRQTGLSELYKPNLTYYLNKADKLINSPKPSRVKSTVWIGNKRYKAVLDATNLNSNQYTALSTYGQIGQAEKNIAKSLALVLYRHRLFREAKFNPNIIKEIEADVMNAKLGDVYGILLFFCKVAEQLSIISPIYLMKAQEEIEREINSLIAEVMPNSEKNMVGTMS